MLAPHIPSAFLSTKSSSQLVFVHPGLKRGPGGCPVLVLSPPSPLLYKVRLVRLPHSYWTGASAWPLGCGGHSGGPGMVPGHGLLEVCPPDSLEGPFKPLPGGGHPLRLCRRRGLLSYAGFLVIASPPGQPSCCLKNLNLRRQNADCGGYVQETCFLSNSGPEERQPWVSPWLFLCLVLSSFCL